MILYFLRSLELKIVLYRFDWSCYNIVSDKTPPLISDLATWREAQYNLRGHKKVTVARFSTKFM